MRHPSLLGFLILSGRVNFKGFLFYLLVQKQKKIYLCGCFCVGKQRNNEEMPLRAARVLRYGAGRMLDTKNNYFLFIKTYEKIYFSISISPVNIP